MEERFVVEAPALDEQSAGALARAMGGKRRWMLFISAALWFAMAVMWWRWINQPFATVVMAAFAAHSLYQGIYFDRSFGRGILRQQNPAEGAGRFVFEADCMRMRNSLEERSVRYAAFLHIVEADKFFFLYTSRTAAHILPKDGFVEGAPEDFAGFIGRKTGKKVVRFKG